MRTRLALGALGAVSLCGVASGDLIIGNLGDASGSGTLFGEAATTRHKAAGFTMDWASFYLDAVTLTIGGATQGSTAHVQIWEGDGGPQSMVADLTDFDFPGFSGPTDFTWSPQGQVVLHVGKTYWVYVENIFEPGDEWLWDSGFTEPSGPGAVNAGYIFNGSPSSTMNTYGVFGTIVPAPAGLAALGVMGAFAARRRR